MAIQKKIGFLLAPGFQPGELINMDAVLGIHPLNKTYYIAENENVVYGNYDFGIEPNATFSNCPKLDVFILVGMNDNQLSNEKLLNFISRKANSTASVIAVNNGVRFLHKSKVISNQNVTSDSKTIELLKNTDLQVEKIRTCVEDGKFITAGPSTGAIEAAFTVLNKLRGKWFTKFVEFNIEYDPIVQYPLKNGINLEQPPLPQPNKVGLLLPKGVYLPDFIGATDVFSKIPNTEFYYINTEPQKVSSKLLGPNTVTNTTIENCPQLDVFIVGATLPKYVNDKKVLDFIISQERLAKAIISVCAGTFVVGATGLLENKNAATNYHQTKDLKKIGAIFNGKEVEVDGKFYSAGPAIGSYEVGLKAVENIVSKEWAQYIEQQVLEFSPKPIYGTNTKNVNNSILRVTNTISVPLRQLFRPAIKQGYKYGKKNMC